MTNWQRFLPDGCDPVIHGHCHWQNSNGIQRKSGVSCRKRWSAVTNGLSRVEVPNKVEMLKCNFATVSMFFFPDMVMNTSYASTFFCVVPRLLDRCLDLLCRFQSPHVGAGGIGFLEAPRVGSRLPVITCDYHGHGTSTSIDHRPSTSSGLWPDPWSVCNLALRRPGDQEGRTLEVCHVIPCHYVTVEFIGSQWFGTLLNGCAQFQDASMWMIPKTESPWSNLNYVRGVSAQDFHTFTIHLPYISHKNKRQPLQRSIVQAWICSTLIFTWPQTRADFEPSLGNKDAPRCRQIELISLISLKVDISWSNLSILGGWS